MERETDAQRAEDLRLLELDPNRHGDDVHHSLPAWRSNVGQHQSVGVGHYEEVGAELLAVILGDWLHGGRIVQLHGGLEPWQVGDQRRLAREVPEEFLAVFVHERPGFVEAPTQFPLRLCRHRGRRVVRRGADRHHRQQRHGEEQSIGERREQGHFFASVKFRSTSPPSGTSTRLVSEGRDSCQATTE